MMSAAEQQKLRGVLVRAVVALRTGLSALDSANELDDEIALLEHGFPPYDFREDA
jgi:hypothetical protein